MKIIPLTKGKHAMVDDRDHKRLSKHKWSACFSGWGYYAVRMEAGRRIYMHREIMKTPKGKETDHLNGDGLDNRRKNLRVCTRSENGSNRPYLASNNTSGSTGVTFYRRTGKWMAQMKRGKRNICLGYFDKKADAIKARVKALNS